MMRIRIRDVSPNPRRQGRELDFRATPYGRLLHPPTTVVHGSAGRTH
jgi:hypothetical protein